MARMVVLGGIALALAIRFSLFPFESDDYRQFTGRWFAAIEAQGALTFLGSKATNYAPLYTYAMVLAQALFGWLPAVVAIKLIGLPFDFLCGWYVSRIVGLRWNSPLARAFAFVAVLFLPTVLINGAMWGQADGIYTAGLVAFVYYAAVDRPRAACVALGLAFAVKLQALFLLPVVAALCLAGRLPWRPLAWIPGIYLLSALPAWIAGRSLWDLLTIYTQQATYYPRLTSNAAHVYQWFPPDLYALLLPAGLFWSTGVVASFVVVLTVVRPRWDAARLVEVATICLILVPFCTPKMHERYYFPADVLAVALAFYRPRLAYVPIVVGLVSFLSYAPFLLRMEIIPLRLLAVAMGALLIALLYGLGTSIARERREKACG